MRALAHDARASSRGQRRLFRIVLFFCSYKVLWLGQEVHAEATTLDNEAPADDNYAGLVNETLQLMALGDKEIRRVAPSSNVTIIVGNSGSQKSTTIQLITQPGDQIYSHPEDEDGLIFRFRDREGAIGTGVQSKTHIPRLVIDPQTKSPFYDCPGFVDNRNVSVEISNAFFVKRVAEMGRGVKILVAADLASVRAGAPRNTFPQLLQSLVTLIKNPANYHNSLALIATKVDLFHLKDAQIINVVAKFLRARKTDLPTNFTPAQRKASLEILDALLEKRDGSYSRIGLLWSPREAGNVSDLPEAQKNVRDLRRVIFDNLEYTERKEGDFGVSLSPEGNLGLNSLLSAVNYNIVQTLKNLTQGIQDDLIQRLGSAMDSSKMEPDDLTDLIRRLTSVMTLAELTIDADLDSNSKILSTLRTIDEEISQIAESPPLLGLVSNLGYQQEHLKFLIDAKNGGSIDLHPEEWLSPLKHAASMLKNHLHSAILPRISTTFNLAMKSLADLVTSTLLSKYNPANEEFGSKTIEQMAQRLKKDLELVQEFRARTLAALNSSSTDAEFVQTFLVDFQSFVAPLPRVGPMSKLVVSVRLLEIIESALPPTTSTSTLNESSRRTECRNLADKALNFLSRESTWYSFLVQLSQDLSGADVQVTDSLGLRKWARSNPPIAITSRDSFTNFYLQFGRLKSIFAVGASALTSAIEGNAEEKLRDLSDLLNSYLQDSITYSYDAREGTGTVEGDFVVLSEVIKRIGGSWPSNLLTITVSSTIFLDVDLVPQKNHRQTMSVAIFAPIWWTPSSSSPTINLSGFNYGQFSKSARDPPNSGGNGFSGASGEDGGNAGNFFGIWLESQIGRTLTVSLDGGDGGPGQDGGNGAPGMDGQSLAVEDIPVPTKCYVPTRTSGQFIIPDNFPYGGHYSGGCEFGVGTCPFLYFGQDGKPGHRGGDGGPGGRPGSAGKFTFYNPSSSEKRQFPGISASYRDGRGGSGGKGGAGGQGGKEGNGIRLKWKSTTDLVGAFTRNFWCELADSKIYESTWKEHAGNPGENGASGSLSRTSTAKDLTPVALSLVNRFRYRARSILLSNKFLAPAVFNFLVATDKDTSIRSLTTPLALVEELSDLSKQMTTASILRSPKSTSFRSPANKVTISAHRVAFLPFLESLGRRVHAKVQSLENRDSDGRKALQMVYTATLSLVVALRAGKDSYVVVHIEPYFESVARQLQELQTKITSQQRRTLIETEKATYGDQIKEKLEEANKFISDVISPEIEKIQATMEGNIESLLDEIADMRADVHTEISALEKKKAALRQVMMHNKIFGVLKMTSQALSYLGPKGMAASAMLGAGVGIAENFVPKGDANKVIPRLVLPESIAMAQRGVTNSFSAYMDGQLGAFTRQMADIGKRLEATDSTSDSTPASSKDLKAKLAAIQSRVAAAQAKVDAAKQTQNSKTGGSDPLQTLTDTESELSKARSELRTALEEEKTAIESKKDLAKASRQKIMRRLEIAGQLADLSSTGIQIYNKYKEDEEAIGVVAGEIEAARGKLKQLDIQRDNVIETLRPMIEEMHKDMTEFQAGLEKQSGVALEVSKWKVTTTLRELQNEIQSSFTAGTDVDQSMVRLFEKLTDALSTLINIYDRLQAYGDSAQLVNFIAVVNQAGLEVSPIQNTELRRAVESLDVVLQSGLILDRFEKAMRAFQLWVFPLAHTFNFELKLAADFGQGGDARTLSEMALAAGRTLREVMDKRKNAEQTTGVYNSAVHEAQFCHDFPCPHSFCVWRNETHRSEIRALLRGESVFFVSPIAQSPVGADAIKFKNIRLEFFVPPSHAAAGAGSVDVDGSLARDIQNRLNSELAKFLVDMTHLGNSDYRYKGNFNTLTSSQVQIRFSMAKKDGNLLVKNGNYKLLDSGDLVLSPYATWKIRLEPLRGGSGNGNTAEDFAGLARLLAEEPAIDIELNGKGTFVDPTCPALCSQSPILPGNRIAQVPQASSLIGLGSLIGVTNGTNKCDAPLDPLPHIFTYHDQQRPAIYENSLYIRG